jgi:tetratricopeptide (TPR) repeat protein
MANCLKKNQPTGRVPAKATATNLGVQRLPPAWFRRDWLWGLILILSVTLTYAPIWRAGFIWDDDNHLTANPCIVGPLGFKEIWTTRAADICPLVLTTFGVEHALWGLEPLPYHLVNVLLHGACALLLWRVLRSLRVQGAWLGAALWALHPVEVESVAWITEMKNTESGLFFLLSVLFFVRRLRAKDLGARTEGGWNYALTLLFAALAMASKSSTVILPVILCLCAWWLESRWDWRHVRRLAPIFLMSVAASALSMWTQSLQLATVTDPQWVRTWPGRLATAGYSIWFYLGKLLCPYPLMTVYPRWQIDSGQWFSYLPLLAVVFLFSILWLQGELWSRACFFAFAYFTAALLPVLGFIDNFIFHYSLVFDHFQYLASIGPLALIGTGLARFSSRLPKRPLLHASLCAELLLVLAFTSWERTWAYENPETLWTDTLAKNPNCWVGDNNLGLVFLQKGQIDEAVEKFQHALEINPDYREAYSNLGLAFFQKGRLDEAITNYQKALEMTPKSFVTRCDLGNALLREGRTQDAVVQYEKALEIEPNYEEARSNLGLAFLQRGELEDAFTQYERAVLLDGNSFATHYNLGVVLLQKGRPDEATKQFQRALQLKPDFSPAQINLAKALGLPRLREDNQ